MESTGLDKIITAYNSFNYQGHLDGACDLYHYTTLSTLQLILKGKKLRFTNWAYLNDKSEGIYVLSFCKENIDKIWTWGDDVAKENTKAKFCKYLDKAIENVTEVREKLQGHHLESYQASFSCKPDSLTMWNYYTHGSGCSLKFSDEFPLNLKSRLSNPDKMTLVLLCGKVIYDDERKIKILRDIFDYFKSASTEQGVETLYACMIECVLKMGAFFKHPGFEDEREYRIVCNLNTADNSNTFRQIVHPENGAPYKREIYNKQGMLVPYVDIDFDLKYLKGITVSPTTNFEKVQTGINILLYEQGIKKDDIPIDQSDIPLRF